MADLADPGTVPDDLPVAPPEDDAEALYDRAPCGYLTTRPDGTILNANRTLLRLLGYDRADLVGVRRFADLLTGGGRIYHETHYAPMLQMQGSARAIALDIVRADGVRVPVLVTAVLEHDEQGAPTVIRAAIFDATERRGYERQLLEAKRRAEASEATASALAHTLQKILIPPAPPLIPGLDIAAVYRPAGTGAIVGGDFYDVFEVGAGDWIVVAGDVCGKGADAAVVTSHARHSIREAAVRHERPSEMLHHLNRALLQYGADRFCTAVVMRWQHRDGRWRATASCGGHPLPLLRRPPTAPVAFGEPGSLIGVFDNPTYEDREVVLQPGDTIVLYTDGVTEGRFGGEFYGEARLQQAIDEHTSSAQTLVDGVLADVLAFQADDAFDDIVLVAMCVP